MVQFENDPDQCHLKMTLFHLVYVLTLNILIIFIPTIGLTILYIIIIFEIKKHMGIFSFLNDSNESKIIRIRNCSAREYTEIFTKEITNTNYKSRNSIINLNLTVIKDNNMMTFDHQSGKVNRNNIENLFKVDKNLRNDSSVSLFVNKPCFKNEKSNKLKLTMIISSITIVFFCFQLPVRLFLCWSYLNHYLTTYVWNDFFTVDQYYVNIIDLFSNISSLIYFLHCISNPIIYNLISTKFRQSFIEFFRLKC